MKKIIFVITISVVSIDTFPQTGIIDTTYNQFYAYYNSVITCSNRELGLAKAVSNIGGETYVIVNRDDLWFYSSKTGSCITKLGYNGNQLDYFTPVYPCELDIEEYQLYDALVSSEGDLVVAGFSDHGALVWKMNSTGECVMGFAGSGIQTTDSVYTFTGIIEQDDGKLVTTGNNDNPGSIVIEDDPISIVRFNANGTFDSTFNDNGVLKIETPDSGITFISHAIALLPDSNYIVAGMQKVSGGFGGDFFAVKILKNGTVDTSFGSEGFTFIDFNVSYDECYDVVISHDNRILLTGNSANYITAYSKDTNRIAICALTLNGDLDSTYADNGKNVLGFIDGASFDAELQQDGKLLVSGEIYKDSYVGGYNKFGSIIRFNESGSIDSSFCTNGIYIHNIDSTVIENTVGFFYEDYLFSTIASVNILPDGKIIAVASDRVKVDEGLSVFDYELFISVTRLHGDSVEVECPDSVNAGFQEIECFSDVNILPVAGTYAGIWTGLGIVDQFTGEFDPSIVGIGNETEIIYNYNLYSCDISDTIWVTIGGGNLGQDFSVCGNDTIILDIGSTDGSYLWSTGDTTGSILVDTTGYYSISYDYLGCTGTEEISVNVYPFPEPGLPDDTTLCESGVLGVANPSSFYLWSTGEYSSTIEIEEGGTYWVLLSTPVEGCLASDTIEVFVDSFQLMPDSILCTGDTIIVYAGSDSASYLWTTGDTTNNITVTESGIYGVTYTNEYCSLFDEVSLLFTETPTVNLGNDTIVCSGYVLNAGSVDSNNIIWNTASTDSSITISETGVYVCSITENTGLCFSSDSITITIPEPAEALCSLMIEGLTVTFTNTSTSGTYSYYYDFGDGTVSTEENPVHTYVIPGEYKITFTEFDSCTSDTYHITLLLPTSIENISNTQNIYILTNPAIDDITINITTNNTGYKLTIYDLSGKHIDTFFIDGQTTHIDIQQFTAGIYLFAFEGNNGIFQMQKVIIQ